MPASCHRHRPPPSFRRKPETTHPNPQGQPVNARRRSTTETAEAWKGRGPRLSPGRRSRAIGASFVSNGGRKQPPNPSSRPPLPSFRRKQESTHPPGLRSPASCQRHRHPTRHSGESRNPRTPTLRDSPLNSTLRSTTETAEAWKGRGPRLSPGRRSRAAPHPSFRRKPESTHPNPQGQRVDSTLRPTTEAAEAWKRRGPRLSPGRRSRAIGETE